MNWKDFLAKAYEEASYHVVYATREKGVVEKANSGFLFGGTKKERGGSE